MDDRRKLLEMYAAQMKEGNPLAEDFVKKRSNAGQSALSARNLAEETLANEVLKNTGIPVPASGAPRLKQEDFLNRIMQERYPELEPNISLNPALKDSGAYIPTEGKILVKPSQDITRNVGTALHEAGHQYDDKILKFDGTDDVKLKNLKADLPAGRRLQDIDPAQAYEMIAKGHHAEIPKLREGSYGLGALKSMLKSGTFKSMAGALPVVGGLAAAGMSGDASAAIPGLDEAEDVGESREEEREMLNEVNARNNYRQSQARADALAKLKQKP